METCSKEGCNGEVRARNLCSSHYYRFMKYESTDRPKCSIQECSENVYALDFCRKHYSRYIRNEATDRSKCSVKNCDNNSSVNGLCTKHYQRLRIKGDVSVFSCYEPNRYIDNADGTHTIILTDKPGNIIGETIIDSGQFAKVSQYKWYLGNGYAVTEVNKTTKSLHQIIFPVPEGYVTDHIDRDKLNNRLSNLRKCTRRQNNINKDVRAENNSGYTGVAYSKKERKWVARITNNGCLIYLGFFLSKEEAIITRLQAEKKYFQEFAPQKHLFEQYGIALL